MQSDIQRGIIEALRNLLAKGDEVDRCYACRTLGALGATNTIADVVAALRDPDVDVSTDAAWALGCLGDPAAVPPLLESLYGDPSSEVKIAVLEALVDLGDERVVPHLLDLARGRPRDMVFAQTDGDWDPWWDLQRIAVKALGQMGAGDAVPVLVEILEDENQEGESIENEIFTALAGIGGAGEAALIRRLTMTMCAGRERRRAVRALGRAHSAASLHALAGALEDNEDDVRAAAVEALVQRKAGRYATTILERLKDPAPQVRRAALHAIYDLSDCCEIDGDELIALAGDDDLQVRLAALKLLIGGAGGDVTADLAEVVQVRLADPATEAAIMACQLAGRLKGPAEIDALLTVLRDGGRDRSVRAHAAIALGSCGEAAQNVLSGLVHALWDEEQNVRAAALHALMTLAERGGDERPTHAGSSARPDGERHPTPLDLLIGALKGELAGESDAGQHSGDVDTKCADTPQPQSGMAAGDSGAADEAPPGAVEPRAPDLSTVLRDYDEVVGAAASPAPACNVVSTLDAVALDNTENALHDETLPQAVDDETVITQLPEALREEMGDYLDVLWRRRETWNRVTRPKDLDVKTDVRMLSARMLGGCGRPEVVEALIQSLQDAQPEVQQEAAKSIARIARQAPSTGTLRNAVGPLVTRLSVTGNDGLRLACIEALGALGRASVLPILRECLVDDDAVIRSQAARAMVEMAQAERGATGQSGRGTNGSATVVATIIMDCLGDENPRVRKAAAHGLAELNTYLARGPLRAEIGHRLVQAGCEGEENLAGDMGRAIRAVCPEQGAVNLTAALGRSSTSVQRRRVMEMLVEVYQPPADAFDGPVERPSGRGVF